MVKVLQKQRIFHIGTASAPDLPRSACCKATQIILATDYILRQYNSCYVVETLCLFFYIGQYRPETEIYSLQDEDYGKKIMLGAMVLRQDPIISTVFLHTP
jgi:hypothetical protein